MTEDRGTGSVDLDWAIAEECRLNPLWLSGRGSGSSALEIRCPNLALGNALSSLYRTVEQVPVEQFLQEKPHASLPQASGSFNLVTMYGHCPSLAQLEEIRRVLVPGGTAFIGVQNRLWYGHFKFRPGEERSARGAGPGLARRMGRIGFQNIQQFFLDRSLASPRDVLPVHPFVMKALPTLRAREWGRRSVRMVLLRLGLSEVCFPGRLIIAER